MSQASPTTGILNITSQIPIVEVSVFNQLGQEVYKSANANTVDLSAQNSGLYLVKITDENGTISTKKVIKP